MSRTGRWARRAAISLLTGGGLTVVGLGGPGAPASAHAAGTAGTGRGESTTSTTRTVTGRPDLSSSTTSTSTQTTAAGSGSGTVTTSTSSSTSTSSTGTSTSSSTSSSSTSSSSSSTSSSTSSTGSQTSSTETTTTPPEGSATTTTQTSTTSAEGTQSPAQSTTTTTTSGRGGHAAGGGQGGGQGQSGGRGHGGLSVTGQSPQGASVSGEGKGRGGRPAHHHPAGGSQQRGHQHHARHRGAGSRHAGQRGGSGGAHAHNGIALPPQLVASQAEALSSLLGNPAASVQALDYYRIPLFLLPIYQAAAAQYGVPWQVLAAINEVETNYGNDLAVSTAGAIGWMQFMPETWLQYGVDVQDAGYADPYNPLDAIFAAARYLKAAGAASSLSGAVFAYNHSQAYVQSVLLRARLIGHYPTRVIATLTGLAEGRLPVAGALATGESLLAGTGRGGGRSGSTLVVRPGGSSTAGSGRRGRGARRSAALPGSVPAPPPSAAGRPANAKAKAQPQRFAEISAARHAPVVAVQDGKIVAIGRSRRLGRYVILRDVYGNLFTYADLGSVKRNYRPAGIGAKGQVPGAVLAGAASASDPAPSAPATAGHQPITLHPPAAGGGSSGGERGAGSPAAPAAPQSGGGGGEGRAPGKVRMFANPGNPYARAAAVRARRQAARAGSHRLRRGAVVTQGTVLGTLSPAGGSHGGRMRFSIRPAGDPGTVAVQPVLQSWRQLHAALHPKGAKREAGLIGSTAGDAFLLSRGELKNAVLSDPEISLDACARRDVSIGAVAERPLAALVFLSRSGLKPTVSGLPCLQKSGGGFSAPGTPGLRGPQRSISIAAVNGTKIAGHQGPGSIADLTERTLLTLQGADAPAQIASLMHYPGSPSTIAGRRYADAIRVSFGGAAAPAAAGSHGGGAGQEGQGGQAGGAAGRAGRLTPLDAVHSTTAARAARGAAGSAAIGANHWSALVLRIGTLSQPTIGRKPSSAAVPDPRIGHGAGAPAAGKRAAGTSAAGKRSH